MVPFALSVGFVHDPGRNFAAGGEASFAEDRIGYREWARRNGRLHDIHSLDDRYDHDIDELLA
jgi:hypothetical protein